MKRNRKIASGARAAAGVLVALVLVVGCGGNGEDASPTQPPDTPTEAAEETTTAEVPAPPPPPPPAPAGPVRVAVTVRDGAVVGGVRHVSVDRGRDVVLVVRADVQDHMHLHGYDLLTDVAPGSPGRITFEASMEGQFEVELEETGVHIALLTVRR